MRMRKLLGKMAEAGVTQRELASSIGISENTLSSRISGRSPFKSSEMESICRELGISLCDMGDIFFESSSQKNGTLRR